MSHPHSRYVQPEVTEARIQRLWGNLSERLEQGQPARTWRWVVLCTALSGAAAGALLYAKQHTGPAPSAVLAAAKLETAADPLAVTLVDGSSLRLSSRTELSVRESQPSAVLLALAQGEVTCDVDHREGRTFTVLAHDVEVRVVGTKFSIKATPEAGGARVEVSVLRGVVEIRSQRQPGIVARVAAGQSWIQLPSAAKLAEVANAAAPRAAEPAADLAPAQRDDAGKASPSAAPFVAAAGPTARELFEKAGEHRRAGDAAGAAHAYEELLKLHPGDARASLSAFELGRLRMDRLGDQAGAIAALERAVAQNVGPSFREDALARLVSVYAAQGNFAACGRARDRYLASYPAGVHAAAVGTRCGTR